METLRERILTIVRNSVKELDEEEILFLVSLIEIEVMKYLEAETQELNDELARWEAGLNVSSYYYGLATKCEIYEEALKKIASTNTSKELLRLWAEKALKGVRTGN